MSSSSPAPMEELLPATSISSLLHRELFHIPDRSLLIDPLPRLAAIEWLLKVREIHGFHFLTVTLSVNYLDRFLSLHPLPTGKAWMMQLLSVACLSLAAKMEETEVPLSLDLQVESECVFEAGTIQRMELLVLSTLEWRMNSVTPFSYVSCFVHNILGITPNARRHIVATRTNELLLQVMKEATFISYRPSSVAAAAILCALQSVIRCSNSESKYRSKLLSALPEELQAATERCYEIMCDMFVVRKPICEHQQQQQQHVQKKKKKKMKADDKCCRSWRNDKKNIMKNSDVNINGNDWSSLERPRSPAGVLEATFSSSSSESHGGMMMMR